MHGVVYLLYMCRTSGHMTADCSRLRDVKMSWGGSCIINIIYHDNYPELHNDYFVLISSAFIN